MSSQFMIEDSSTRSLQQDYPVDNKPVVSIVIPVYNTSPYFPECLDSVIGQTFKNIEILCINDGSTDEPGKVLNGYAARDNRITVINQENQGLSAARNVGMTTARGDYIYFLDSDDYCELDLIEKTLNEALKNQLIDVVIFDQYRFDNETNRETPQSSIPNSVLPPNATLFSHTTHPDKIFQLSGCTTRNKLFKRSFLLKNKIEFFPLTSVKDLPFGALCMAKANVIAYLPHPYIHCRTNCQDSITKSSSGKIEGAIQGMIELDTQVKDLPYYTEIKNSLREFIITSLLNALDLHSNRPNTKDYQNHAQAIADFFTTYPLFHGMKREDLASEQLWGNFSTIKLNTTGTKNYGPGIIVSLTSFPERIGTAHVVIENMLNQTKKADKIVLTLSKLQFPRLEEDLPENLLACTSKGLEILWTEDDLKSHKKYFYTMQKYPDHLIITVDDDLKYSPRTIEELYDSYTRFPQAISALRTHLISITDNEIDPYASWEEEYSEIINTPCSLLFPTTGAGTLYPPAALHKEAFNYKNIVNFCINADDVWLNIMQIMNNTPTVLVEKIKKLEHLENTQQLSLWHKNKLKGHNDLQMREVLACYNNFHGENDTLIERAKRDSLLLKETPRAKKNALEIKIAALEDEKAQLKDKYNVLEDEKAQLKDKYNVLEAQKDSILKELSARETAFKNSNSYRIGRAITFLPRKIAHLFSNLSK